MLEMLLRPTPHLLHAQNGFGDTPLHCAVREGHVNCMYELLSCGATVSGICNRGGMSVVHVAVVAGSVEILDTLLEHGANIEERQVGQELILRPALVKSYILLSTRASYKLGPVVRVNCTTY